MFTKTLNTKQKKIGISTRPISMLAEGCSFKGKIFLRGEVRLGGHIEGQIVAEDDLILEESAVIDADIHGINVQISGQVNGNVVTQGILILTPTARMNGNIQTPHLIIEDGAILHGNVSIDETGETSKTKIQRNMESEEQAAS